MLKQPPAPHPLLDDEPRHPKPWERGVTLDEAVTWMIANEAGLDGRAIALSGQAAQPVLKFLRAAAQAPSDGQRARLASRAKAALDKLNSADHEALFEHVTARIGELTHASPSVNPETGLQEFASRLVNEPPLPRVKPTELPSMIQSPIPGGVERNDADGNGWFGASRDAGTRTHKGVDILASAPDDPVFAPISGTIGEHVWTSNKKNRRIVNIEGTGPYDGLKARLFYVDPGSLKVGTSVTVGDPVGSYHDVRAAYPERKNMQHHVHMETLYDGQHVDPATLLPNWKTARPST